MRKRRRNLLFGQWHPRALFDAGQSGVIYLPHPSTTWQDSARTTPGVLDSPVGAIDDLSGNSNHALQATADRRPILRRTAGGHWYLDADGSNDFLRVAFTYAQPMERISAIRALDWGNQNRLFGGVTATRGGFIQNSGSPRMDAFSGTTGVFVNVTLDTDFVTTERHDGVNSRVALDNNGYTTGDAGTSLGGGITLFSVSTDGVYGRFRLYGVVMGSFSNLSDAQIQLTRNFMARRAGIILDP